MFFVLNKFSVSVIHISLGALKGYSSFLLGLLFLSFTQAFDICQSQNWIILIAAIFVKNALKIALVCWAFRKLYVLLLLIAFLLKIGG